MITSTTSHYDHPTPDYILLHFKLQVQLKPMPVPLQVKKMNGIQDVKVMMKERQLENFSSTMDDR